MVMSWQYCGDASAMLCRWCDDVTVMRWKRICNIVVMWQCSLMLWRCVGDVLTMLRKFVGDVVAMIWRGDAVAMFW